MSQLRIYNGTSWVPVTDQEHRDATDPHTQYHNDTRGDARYYTISAVDSLLAGVSPNGHTHPASDIVSGTIATARLGSGVAGMSTVLKGDSSWSLIGDLAPSISHNSLSGLLTGDPHTQYLNTDRGDARYGQLTDLTAAFTAVTDSIATKADATHTHAASDIASGTVATARLGTGTADSTTFLRGDQTWAVPAGGAAALGLWDWWAEQRFTSTATVLFTPASIASGVANGTSGAATSLYGYASYGVLINSHATTTNAGGRWHSANNAHVWFGAIGWKYRAQFYANALTDVTIRAGFHDSTSHTDAVDGVYFESNGTTLSAKTSNNSTRTTNATTYTLANGNLYTLEIDVNAAGTEARYRVWANDNTTAVMDVTNTTNIPTTSARVSTPNLVCTKATAGAVTMIQLLSMGFGTIPGYTRDRG